jgi:holo-[acyl-carrier protein] synthase
MSVPLGAGRTSVVGLGIDAVDVERFRGVLVRRPGLAERVFTDLETTDVSNLGDPAQHLAARFAAKEAVMKALGSGIGGFAFRDVEVVRSGDPGARRGAPSLRLRRAAAALAAERGVQRWHVSLTHTAALAMAVVVAESDGAAED